MIGCTISSLTWNRSRARRLGRQAEVCNSRSQKALLTQFPEGVLLNRSCSILQADSGRLSSLYLKIYFPLIYNMKTRDQFRDTGIPKAGQRMTEYFLPRDGIDREVITADICRYLGNDTTIRPGNYEVMSNFTPQDNGQLFTESQNSQGRTRVFHKNLSQYYCGL